MLLGSQAIADRHGLVPRGRILASAVAGVALRVMGRRARLAEGLDEPVCLADMDVEVNGAFATQVLAACAA